MDHRSPRRVPANATLLVVVHYVVRHGSRDWLRHLVVPALGFLILLYRRRGGSCWPPSI